jgi:hypothetical protein
MNFKQLKEWVNSIPEEKYGNLNVVFRTFDDIGEDYVTKVDNPIVCTYVDTLTSEICMMDSESADRFEEMMEEEGSDKLIPINIWDDYYESGDVPEGEKQESFLMVDDGGDIPLDGQHEILLEIEDYIETHLDYPEIIMDLKIRNTHDLYPTLPKNMHSIDWRLFITGLTHKRRYELIKDLEDSHLPLNVYSES